MTVVGAGIRRTIFSFKKLKIDCPGSASAISEVACSAETASMKG